ncbi:nucleotidyltransferase [Hyphomicrobium sp.]|uniref:SMODS domain-containing nucleotidyltransferase n=1 Tax=Hyphomicrobium sp. TaxID=82 RepID=UPI001D2495EB|nr:nucleotidyltransferase [Hyphomicrobium sp.]MBY0559138.1 nucleotidyltransferase [Hyphomicrobium sp.]
MSVSDWFIAFNRNLIVSNAGDISYRYRRITRQLNTDFWDTESESSHSLYVGSYGRDSAIDGISDIDMAFWLPYSIYKRYNEYSGNGQSALLQSVKTSIQKTYPSTALGADGQVLVVSFSDGMKFEVLPCFENNDDSFTYPDSNDGGRWRTTNPRAEIKAMKLRHEAVNNNLRPLCRMMRSWKYKWDVPISGVLIDTLAYQFLETYEYRDKSYMYYDWICRDFFDHMAIQPSDKSYWLAPGSGRYVWRSGTFEHKARRCCNLAKDAIAYESKQQHYSAKSTWREIFGSAFPS